MDISTFSLALIFSYLITLKLLSIFAYRKSQSSIEDFFIVGRTLSSWLLIGTTLATIVNGLAVTAVPALVYEGGLLFSQMFVVCLVLPILIRICGPIIWEHGKAQKVFTQGELFSKFYSSQSLKYLVAIIGILSVLPFMCIQLSAVGKILHSISNTTIAYETGVLLCAASIGLYLYFGGARAVVWTDFFQSIIFLGVIIATAVLFSYWAGGPLSSSLTLAKQIPEKLVFNETNTPKLIDNILSWPFAFFLWPQLFQRMFMASSKQAVKKTAGYTGILLLLVICCSLVSGISATSILYGQITDSDQLLAEMYSRYLPIGGSFIALAAFATGMSTVDSMLLTLTSISIRDFKGRSSSVSKDRELRRSKLIAMFYLITVTFLALSPSGRGAMTPLVTLGASLATLFLWPLLGMHPRIHLGSTGVHRCIYFGLASILLCRFGPLGAYLPFGYATAGFLAGFSCFITHAKLIKSSKALAGEQPQKIIREKIESY